MQSCFSEVDVAIGEDCDSDLETCEFEMETKKLIQRVKKLRAPSPSPLPSPKQDDQDDDGSTHEPSPKHEVPEEEEDDDETDYEDDDADDDDVTTPQEKIIFELSPQFVFKKTICASEVSNVYLVKRKKDKRKFCLKVVVRSRSERKHLPLELRMHSYFKLQAQHPVHVQRMESFILLHNVYAFVSPYIADTLHTAHELDDIFLIMYQLLLGLEALHKVNVIHRDIKPSNLLWDGAELTIIDYDKAAWSLPGLYHFHRMGTEAFMAPEVLRYTRDSSLKLESYTTKCDIYSAGVVFGCLLFGIRESDSLEMHVTIFREQASQLFGEALGDFLQALLQFRPGKRISASKALHHAFFNTCQSVQTYKQKSQEPPPLLVEPAN